MLRPNLVLHPRVVASPHAAGFCVLQLVGALQFQFALEQQAWFEAMKSAKDWDQVAASLPGETKAKTAFLLFLLEKQVLLETTNAGTGDLPGWGGAALPDLGSLGQTFSTAKPQEWQLGFAFADTIASSLLPAC